MNKDFETDKNGRIIKINNYIKEGKPITFYSIKGCDIDYPIKAQSIFWKYHNWDSEENRCRLEYLMSLGNLFDSISNAKEYLKWKKIDIEIQNLYEDYKKHRTSNEEYCYIDFLYDLKNEKSPYIFTKKSEENLDFYFNYIE